MKRKSNCPAIRVVMMPKDTNPMGNIFGGVLSSLIDQAGAVAAQSICSNRVVTVCMDKIEFKRPVHVGDVLTCWAKVTRVGNTSMTTHVEVEVQRNGEIIPVTEGTIVYVAVDENGQKTPVKLYEKQHASCARRKASCRCSKRDTKRSRTKSNVSRS